MWVVLLGLFVRGFPLAADTVDGTVFRDDDANGVQAEAESGVEGLRNLAHAGGQILAQARSGEEGRFQLEVEGEVGTEVHLLVAGLQGRFVAKTSPGGPIRLTGSAEVTTVHLALVDVAQLQSEQFKDPAPEAHPLPGATKVQARSTFSSLNKLDFPGGLPFPNVGTWVTLRCAGANNRFDIDPAMDDILETAAVGEPNAEPHHEIGSPYNFVHSPVEDERCRVLSEGEIGAVPPGG